MVKKKKFTFILKNIDPEEIDKKYGIEFKSNLQQDNKPIRNITKIDKLSINANKNFYSYLDESKKNHRCAVSMFNYVGKQLPEKTNICCFWCKNRFSSIPIGCPIKYIPHEIVKTYLSEITKDKYVIRQNISNNKKKELLNDQNDKIEIISKNYFQTDGIFCSFNCCLSFIEKNKKDFTYYYSKSLLLKMFKLYFPNNNINLQKAPNWRLLKDYGGHLSIEEFRENFYKIEYNDIEDYITELPKSYSIGFLHEQKINM